MTKEFRHTVSQTRGGNICFITTQDAKGRDAYYFVLLKNGMADFLKKQIKVPGMLDLTKFGQIVASGFGHKPPATTLRRLGAEYQYEFAA
jgi:hypothetical protein